MPTRATHCTQAEHTPCWYVYPSACIKAAANCWFQAKISTTWTRPCCPSSGSRQGLRSTQRTAGGESRSSRLLRIFLRTRRYANLEVSCLLGIIVSSVSLSKYFCIKVVRVISSCYANLELILLISNFLSFDN